MMRASVEMTKLAALALAVRISVAERSRRSGLALISGTHYVALPPPLRASKSKGNASRCSRMRPVGCPIARRCGHSSARSNRSVTLRWLQIQCSCGHCPTTQSSSASASFDRSIFPSRMMSHSTGEHAQRQFAPIVFTTTHFSNLMRERHRSLFIQAIGHRQGLRMIRDSDVSRAPLPRRLRHLRQRRPPIAFR